MALPAHSRLATEDLAVKINRAIPFLVVALTLAACPARAQEWRFCVGVAATAHESVITDIFASEAQSAQIEHRLEAYFRSRRGKTLTFQCPRGAQERFAALNAQTTALQFNRQMGFAVSGLPASDVTALVSAAR
jgi:hypothetical protein